MALIRNYFGNDVSAVQVFYAPRIDKWVLRVIAGCGLLHGDLSIDEEPTDEELRAAFGDIKILRGYSFATLVDEMLVPSRTGTKVRSVYVVGSGVECDCGCPDNTPTQHRAFCAKYGRWRKDEQDTESKKHDTQSV